MREPVILTLPFPPSVNNYWRHGRNGNTYVSERGEEYRLKALIAVINAGKPRIDGRLLFECDVYPPNYRLRDIGNLNKSLEDALQACGVFKDDEQIDRAIYTRREVRPGGLVVVRISQLSPELLGKPILSV